MAGTHAGAAETACVDTRTPLLTNTLQLTRRALVIALLLDGHGAVTSKVETVALDAVLLTKLRRPDTGLVPSEPTFVPAS